jgi:hypothetical protein
LPNIGKKISIWRVIKLLSAKYIYTGLDADNKDGFTQDIERTLRENGKTLGFGNVEFE